jgi:hypothetical protein
MQGNEISMNVEMMMTSRPRFIYSSPLSTWCSTTAKDQQQQGRLTFEEFWQPTYRLFLLYSLPRKVHVIFTPCKPTRPIFFHIFIFLPFWGYSELPPTWRFQSIGQRIIQSIPRTFVLFSPAHPIIKSKFRISVKCFAKRFSIFWWRIEISSNPHRFAWLTANQRRVFCVSKSI